MTKMRRQFTPQEKYSILQAAEREGIAETARKYNLSYTVLSRWNQEYPTKGKNELKVGYKKAHSQLRTLEKENERLKKIIANQALELESKTERLKKYNTYYQKARG
ncbi:MAG: transposase [Chitinophagaceae bacterium]|nr:transposase [Chitinophagaceae bacterium]